MMVGELGGLLEAVRRFLEAFAGGELKPSRVRFEMDRCVEPSRPPRIRGFRFNPVVEEVVEELVNSPLVLDALAREFNMVFEPDLLSNCDFIWEIKRAGDFSVRRELILRLEPSVRRQLLEVYAERLLDEALEEYEWSLIGGGSEGEAIRSALELVERILRGERPKRISLVGAGPWSPDLEKAVIAGARVTFQDAPYLDFSERRFSVVVPVTTSLKDAARRLLAAVYSLMLVSDGVGPCDYQYTAGIPYCEFLVEMTCPECPAMRFPAREMVKVSRSELEEAKRVADFIVKLSEEDFRHFATAMMHYWQSTTETNEANRITHLVAALDKALRKAETLSRLSVLPCKVALLLGSSQAVGIVEEAVRLRNRVQHGVLPPEAKLSETNEKLESVVRSVLKLVLQYMRQGRYRELLRILDSKCSRR